MKKTAQIAVIGALLAVGIAQSYAQTTNVVLQLNIALSGFAGADDTSGASPVKISTKDVIAAIVAGNSSLSFGKSAKLMVVVPVDGGSPSFIVRETSHGANTDTDVSDFFSTDSNGGVGNGKTKYEILSLSFDNGVGTSFDVSGFATEHRGNVSGHDTGAIADQTTSLNASVSGTGSSDGTPAVLKGTVTATGGKGEVD